jgi:hypothetical protein
MDDDFGAPKTRKERAVDRRVFGVLDTALQDSRLLGMEAVALVKVFTLLSVDVATIAAALEAVLKVLGATVVAHRDDSLVSSHHASDTA